MIEASNDSVRIVIWNCNMALHAKAERLMALKPDVAIISESARPEIVQHKTTTFNYQDARWVGRSKHKGLAVYVFNGLGLRDSSLYNPDYEHFLPVDVVGDIQLRMLAV